MRNQPKIAIVLLATSLVAGCAGAQPATEDTATNDEPRRCMLVRNVDNYEPIDRNHVVISDRSERAFLLGTMRPSCWDIQSSAMIALQSSPISICAGQTAVLFVNGERCFIRTLEAVDSFEAAESLVQQRNEARESAQ